MLDLLRCSIYGGVTVLTSLTLALSYAIFDHFVNVKSRYKFVPSDLETIHKNGFSIKKMDDLEKERPFDVIIIGSGVSGLTSAVLLARRGWRVLVVEQHDQAGGCTHTFEEKGYEFDTGVHYIGGNVASKKSMGGFLFDLLSCGKLSWTQMENNFDTAKISTILKNQFSYDNNPDDSIIFNCYDDKSKVKAHLYDLFPDEKTGIDVYMRLLSWSEFTMPILTTAKMLPIKLTQLFRRLFQPFLAPYISTTTAEIIRSCTSNRALTGVLAWCYGDYGLPPSQSAFLMNGIISNHYISGHAYYPTGGPANITKTFIASIEALGGSVLVRAPVSKILLNERGDEVIGVHVRGRDTQFLPDHQTRHRK